MPLPELARNQRLTMEAKAADSTHHRQIFRHLLRAVVLFGVVTMVLFNPFRLSNSYYSLSSRHADRSSVFADADIMWFRNPLPRFYSDSEFQVSCDRFWGNSSYMNNPPNTGLMYVKSSNRTVEFFEFWYKSREIYSAKHDQDAFNMLKHDPFISEIGLKIKFLNTAYFGGFCQPSRDLDRVCTMHANCCAGLDNKIHDLRVLLDDWRKYLSLSEDARESHTPSWTAPQSCGPVSFRRRSPKKDDGIKRK